LEGEAAQKLFTADLGVNLAFHIAIGEGPCRNIRRYADRQRLKYRALILLARRWNSQ
jgi:hypothetical protein